MLPGHSHRHGKWQMFIVARTETPVKCQHRLRSYKVNSSSSENGNYFVKGRPYFEPGPTDPLSWRFQWFSPVSHDQPQTIWRQTAASFPFHYLRIYSLLTFSAEQSPSWEANRFSASQEILPHFMETEGSLPQSQVLQSVPILSHLDPVHNPTSHFLKIHLIIIISPSTPGYSKWSVSHQNHVYFSHLPHTR